VSGHEVGPLPGGIPERRQDPPEEEASRGTRPPLPSCECGKPAWVFPAPGKRYCGFCPASDAARGQV